jgi:hypothetical protein
MAEPSAEDQIAVLAGIQRILSEGQFTATYKFALLMAIADLAVELGDDSGAALAVSTKAISEKFIEYYWRHVIPYIPGSFAPDGVILQQNTLGQAAVVNSVRDARSRYGDSLPALRQNKKVWSALVNRVEGVFWNQRPWQGISTARRRLERRTASIVIALRPPGNDLPCSRRHFAPMAQAESHAH